MADREKAIKGFKCHRGVECNDCPYFSSKTCVNDLMADVLEILKNEPLLVLNVTKFNCYHGDCPHCGKRIHYKNTSYCPYCGKAVKWDGRQRKNRQWIGVLQ